MIKIMKVNAVKAYARVKGFFRDDRGINTVEIILILVVLIGLVIIFKGQLTSLVNNIFKEITRKSTSIYK